MKKIFDLILNYDLNQVVKYGLTFYPDFESMIDISCYQKEEKSDVVFVGLAKGRLPIILDCYNLFINRGLRCDFYIVGAPENIVHDYPGIVFSDSYLDYYSVLSKIANTKCILEVIQDSSIGWSARAMKAFGYNKKLVTDAEAIRFTRFYDGHNVQVFDNTDEINVDAIKDNSLVNYNYSDEFSPLRMIEYIDLLLSGKSTTEEYFSEWLDYDKYLDYVIRNQSLREGNNGI